LLRPAGFRTLAGLMFLHALPGLLALVGFLAAPDRSLERSIQALLGDSKGDLQKIAVCVLDASGVEVASINAGLPLKPASNMKVLVTAAALRLLGADHEYETRLVALAPLEDGVIAGHVVVHGTGDPNISGRFYGGDPLALFRRWAKELAGLGLREVRGDLLVDDGYFDDVRFLPGWRRDQENRWYSAQISPLSLNDNCIDVRIRPGPPGERAMVEIVPASAFIRVEGAPTTVVEGATRIIIHRKTGTNQISIQGQINRRTSLWEDNVAIEDPSLFFGHTLLAVLEAEGIRVRGEVLRRERDARAGGAAGEKPEASGVLLVRHTSGLFIDLPVIHKRSQNLHAELLLKALGAQQGGEGSVAGGARAIGKFLAAEGIDAAGLEVGDGSGLSHDNRVSARLLARTLHSVRSRPYFETYRESLPIAGQDGTLADRFRREPELKGRIQAKTGYISGVATLSGYIEKGGTLWTFSMLFNTLPGGPAGVRELQERIAARIHQAMP
jgi:D-alanyl-D-alanine carboxypeptidase/D-alanyl-D-alanine-endopeptidase (penicillin-binding protein 4)